MKPSFENRIQLSAPRTSGQSDDRFSQEGFILKLSVDDSTAGFGEVCNTFVNSTVSLASIMHISVIKLAVSETGPLAL